MLSEIIEGHGAMDLEHCILMTLVMGTESTKLLDPCSCSCHAPERKSELTMVLSNNEREMDRTPEGPC